MKRSGNGLLVGIVLAVAGGLALGWFFPLEGVRLAWIGELFLNALKLLVLPLIFCSMIDAVAGITRRGRLGNVAAATLLYYVATTAIAVTVGLAVVSTLTPGAGLTPAAGQAPPPVPESGLKAIVEHLVRPNLVEAAARFEVLPVLVFALAFGTALGRVGERADAAIAFFAGCNEALLRLVDWLMVVSPAGIGALIAARVGAAGGGAGFADELAAVGAYFVTVLAGLSVHGLVVLPLILRLVAGRRPLEYARNLAEALATAFATASSSATLAVTMRLTEERNRVDAETASFVLPLGATVNMDGTALYEAVAAVFIAQTMAVPMGWAEQVTIAVTATLASIGAAGIPQAGLVTMVIVLEAVGLPLEGISLILAVDWLLDRFRTTVNVWGDAVGAAVVAARRS
ncbi:MAG: dicarboxylate/amino acid:cation symporter [Deltaproteobacteria bacterium]|nr:MAG: dicarboxylate/amino acid:cation symporter [Deltaproteobacteria bacterium]